MWDIVGRTESREWEDSSGEGQLIYTEDKDVGKLAGIKIERECIENSRDI